MKLIPIITAILVCAFLYFLVFDRDTLTQFIPQSPDQDETTQDMAQDIDEDAAGLVRVVAITATARTIESAVVLRGRTEAARQVRVASETSGLVLSEPLRKGTFVNQGDLMCQLDPGTRDASLAEARARLAEAKGRVPEAQAAIAEANARVREAEINERAARALSQDGFASETRLVSAEAVSEAAMAGVQRATSSVASAQAGIEAAMAGVAIAEREIERLDIKAPFAGLLETDTAELGSLMQPGSDCATIIQLDPIKLVGFVPEADVTKIAVGATAGARLTSGEDVTGQVTFLSRSADPFTRTFRVEVSVVNPDLAISDGQTAEIVVATDGRSAHLLPQSSLTLNDDGALGVRTIASGDIAQFMPVTLLRDTTEGVWVAGLPGTVNIITSGQEYVVDGVQVTPTYAGVSQ